MSEAFLPFGTQLSLGDGASPEVFTAVAEVLSLKRSGAKIDFVDVTNMDSEDGFHEYIASLKDSGDVNVSANWIPGDDSQSAVEAAFVAGVASHWQIVLPGSPTLGTLSFTAFVDAPEYDLDFSTQGKINFKLKITGPVDFSA